MNSIFRVEVNQVKMTEKWGKIQGKFELARSSSYSCLRYLGSIVDGFLILIFWIVSIDHTVVEAGLTIE